MFSKATQRGGLSKRAKPWYLARFTSNLLV